jgi:hypothetical protein
MAGDEIRGTLSAGGGLDDQTVVLFKFADPILDIGGRVPLGVLSCNACDGAEESSTSFRDQFLFTVKFISESLSKGASESAGVAGAVD